MKNDSIAGAILGCALGDAAGLPYEGLPKCRGVRLLGEPDRFHFIIRHGMVSDDTEHTCMVAESLCECPHDAELFARCLAGRLRWWLVGVPAGVGFATLRAILRLWLGFSPQRSGVFSAGNGPAMRSAILGAAIDDLTTLERFVRASTVITHSDPKAFHGAFGNSLGREPVESMGANGSFLLLSPRRGRLRRDAHGQGVRHRISGWDRVWEEHGGRDARAAGRQGAGRGRDGP